MCVVGGDLGRGVNTRPHYHRSPLTGKLQTRCRCLGGFVSVYRSPPIPTPPKQKVKAHIFLLTLLWTSITSLFRSVAGKSSNYDSLIAGNLSERLASNRDRQQAKEWLTLERNMTAYMSPNGFVWAFGKTNKQQGSVISHFHWHPDTFNDSPVSDTVRSPNKHFEIADKSFNFTIFRGLFSFVIVFRCLRAHA